MTQFVFLGGMGRSGTNLLRSMLDCHQDIAAGPEFNFSEDVISLYRKMSTAVEGNRISAYTDQTYLRGIFASFLGDLLSRYGILKGKDIVVEKTPSNIWHFLELSHLFPTAKFIQVVRDGRDVCCSHLEVAKRLRQKGVELDSVKDSSLLSVFHCAALWTETVKHGLSECGPQSALHRAGRAMTVRYEDLVTDSETTLREICIFLGVPFSSRMITPEQFYHDTFVDGAWVKPEDLSSKVHLRSVSRWTQELSIEDRVLFASNGMEGIKLLDYDSDPSWMFAGANISPEDAKDAIDRAKRQIEILVSL